MTGRRAGRVVSRGAIRVDARKAVAKLREHQLLDLHQYATEIVRAASAMGATAVEVRHDADDVIVQWAGPAVDAATLVRLLDWVLVEDDDGARRPLRLLAGAVNGALGLDPAFVDLYASYGEADSSCQLVRFTPAIFERAESAESAALSQKVARPSSMPARGMRAHLRRRLGWSVLRRAALGGAPREVALLCEAASDAAIDLRVQGSAPAKQTPDALIQVPMRIAGASRAWLELTGPTEIRPRVDFLEQGMRLASAPLTLGADWPSEPQLGQAIPVRVVVDADALPTNASRSAVREDSPLFAGAMASAQAAFATAVRALLATRQLEPAPTEPVTMCPVEPARFEQALAALVCIVASAARQGLPLGPLARRLLQVPVLRGGTGKLRAYDSLLSRAADPVFVHEGKASIDEELELWLGRVVWPNGGIAERALDLFEQREAAPLVERARLARARRQRLLEHPSCEVAVPTSPFELGRERFSVSDGPFAGLRGEVALLGGAAARSGLSLRLFLEGRPFQIHRVPTEVVPLGLEAAVSWPERLSVAFDFDGIVIDQWVARAAWYAAQVGTMVVRELAERLEDLDPPSRDALRPLLCAAVATTVLAARNLRLSDVEPGSVRDSDPLYAAACWPTTEPGRFESLGSLSSFAKRTRALCVAGPLARGVAVDRRPVLALERAGLDWIVAALGRDVPLVPYEQALHDPSQHPRATAARDEALRVALRKLTGETAASATGPLPALRFAHEHRVGLVGVAPKPACVLLHVGRTIRERSFVRRFGPVAFCIDDDSIVPSPDWDDVRWSRGVIPFDRLERDLLVTIVSALEGDPDARARLLDPPATGSVLDPVLSVYLLESASRLRTQIALSRRSLQNVEGASKLSPKSSERVLGARRAELEWSEDLLDRLRAVELLPMLDARGIPRPSSLGTVEAAHEGTVPYLTEPPGFETLDWQPLLLETEDLVRACRAWSARSFTAVPEHDLEVRRVLGARHAARRRLLAQPRVNPTDLSLFAGANEPTHLHAVERDRGSIFLDSLASVGASPGSELAWSPEDGSASAAVALRPGSFLSEPQAVAEILFRRRPFTRTILDSVPLPIVARVNLVELEHVGDGSEPSDAGKATVRELVVQAALGLVLSQLDAADGTDAVATWGDARLVCLAGRLAALLRGLGQTADLDRLQAAIRRSTVAWPTAQGTVAPWSTLVRPDGAVLVSTRRFVPWHPSGGRASELDEPVLLLSDAVARRDYDLIAQEVGVELLDVTGAMDKLQARRARQAPERIPQLSGAPSHPSLRVKLSSLGVTMCVGELELIDEPAAEVHLVELEGSARRVPADLAVPIRAVARLDTAASARTVARLVRKLYGATSQLLRTLYPDLDDLPSFVRVYALRQLSTELERAIGDLAQIDPADRAARLFVDVDGRYWSLDDVVAGCGDGKGDGVWFTESSPPYPERSYGRVVLCLPDAAVVDRLRSVASIRNMTRVLADDLAGEQRAAASRRATVALSPDISIRCVAVVPLAARDLEGEVGILADAQAPRGIEVLLDRRPLCTIDDGVGWPLAAVVSSTELASNRHFDGLSTRGDRERVQDAVRAAARAHLTKWLEPAAGALATLWIDTCAVTSEDEPSERSRLVGSLWLPAAWPDQPTIRIRTASRPSGEMLGLREALGSSPLEGPLPVQGDLLVIPAGRAEQDIHRRLLELLTNAALSLVEQLTEDSSVDRATRDRYRWDVALRESFAAAAQANDRLRKTVQGLAADTTTGLPATFERVRAELQDRRELWFSDRVGSSDGCFPDREPSFIVAGRDPLVDVLRCRARPGVLLELGGEDAAAEIPVDVVNPEVSSGGIAPGGRTDPPSPEPLAPPPKARRRPRPPRPPGRRAEETPAPASSEPQTPARGWLDALRSKIAKAFGGDDELAAALESLPAGLCARILAEIQRLSLSGDPIGAVVYGRASGGLRYDAKRRAVIVDPQNRAVSALGAEPLDADRIALLVAAAVGEINRELGTVTDQEELRAISDLLVARSSSAPLS